MGKLFLITGDTQREISFESGESALSAIKKAGEDIPSPCGGRGKCGKCAVEIVGEIPESLYKKGIVKPGETKALACGLEAYEGLRIRKLFSDTGWHQQRSAYMRAVDLKPVFDITGDAFLALGVDIGTTTIACYLLDMRSGETIDAGSSMNPQRKFGADVISRINCSIQNEASFIEMRDSIRAEIMRLAIEACKRTGHSVKNILHGVIAGNTVMMHIFGGYPLNGIAMAPFVPEYTDGHDVMAKDIALDFAENAKISLLPCISGFVGADTVACMIAAELEKQDELCLVLDMGTNGEVALGNKERILTCSVAAGPAFEGGHIRFGTGSIKGAINSVYLNDGEIVYTTIDDAPAKGICGTGIVDAISTLLKNGVVDETGVMKKPGSSDAPYAKYLQKFEETNAFCICEASGVQQEVFITQHDVRELQLAKGALAAGIEVILGIWGAKMEDISKVFLAGGFGTALNIESACEIGLLPKVLKERIVALGNGAGAGAQLCAKCKDMLDLSQQLLRQTEYIELSGRADFQELFIDKMMFE